MPAAGVDERPAEHGLGLECLKLSPRNHLSTRHRCKVGIFFYFIDQNQFPLLCPNLKRSFITARLILPFDAEAFGW